jgi:GTP cyclohydrolase I
MVDRSRRSDAATTHSQLDVLRLPQQDHRRTGRQLRHDGRVSTQVADALGDALKPTGVLVVLEAEHLCMSIRGVNKPGSLTVTSAVRGHFRDDARARADAMGFITGHRGR